MQIFNKNKNYSNNLLILIKKYHNFKFEVLWSDFGAIKN